jgi:hypothetical protein
MLHIVGPMPFVAVVVAGTSFAGMPASATASDDFIRPGTPAIRGQALSTEEFRAVLDRADQTQKVLAQLSAVFEVGTVVDLAQLDPSQKAAPALAATGGSVTGKMKWIRDRAAQRVEVAFDLPDGLRMYEFEDEVCVDDGQMQVKYYPRTRQTAIIASGDLTCRTPSDWLLPGFRQSFRAMQSDPRTRIEAFHAAGDDVLVCVSRTYGSDSTRTVNCLLSPALDYAVTEWVFPASGYFVTIGYRRDQDGRVIPVKATRSVFRPGQTRALRVETLCAESISVGPPDPAALRFEFNPGMLVADNRYSNGDNVKIYRVDKGGAFEEVPAPAVNPARSSLETFGLAGAGVLAILGVLAVRARATFRSQRGSITP